MILSRSQSDQFWDEGYVFLTELLSAGEVSVLRSQIPAMLDSRNQELVLEKDGRTIRSIFDMHNFNEVYARFIRHPKLVKAASQLVNSHVHLFQLILNFKEAYSGDIWPWHQDYPTYRADDGMPSPRCVNILVFLDSVNQYNGPLMMVPGSHKEEYPVPELDKSTTGYAGRWLAPKKFEDLVKSKGIVAPKGPAGSVIFAHTNIIHGSGPNMSPWRRAMISMTLNSIDNVLGESSRPGYIVSRDCTPITPLADDCLFR